MRPIIVDIAIICAFAVIIIIWRFIHTRHLIRKHKKCPQCGEEMQIKKKYKIDSKGYVGKLYVWGTIRTSIDVPYCTKCKYEILPQNLEDKDLWKDASEL